MGPHCRGHYRRDRRRDYWPLSPRRWIGNIIAGLVGASAGQWLLGSWGPQLAGMALIPSILGAIILVVVVSLVLGQMGKSAKA